MHRSNIRNCLNSAELVAVHLDTMAWSATPSDESCRASLPKCIIYNGDEMVLQTSSHYQDYTCSRETTMIFCCVRFCSSSTISIYGTSSRKQDLCSWTQTQQLRLKKLNKQHSEHANNFTSNEISIRFGVKC